MWKELKIIMVMLFLLKAEAKRYKQPKISCINGCTVKIRILHCYLSFKVLSRKKAIKNEKWNKLEEDTVTRAEVSGVIKRSIKCGFIVDHVKDAKHLIETEQKFIVLKMDKKQGNIVVSRKLVLEKLHPGEKIKFLESLTEDDVIEGKIKSMTHYGVFVGIHESDVVGGIDGLLHITDISWSRVRHPSAVFACGQTRKVKIIKIDKENTKISLGVKQLEDSP
ncbi:small ribosomal subunit protein bS1-like [Calliopsis andreniformis]|uniref:small ribosomal subunit protein bS1-like n=1 Tax=Calliopsis andreniformis TaxID=337506 RepID=UPI003FCC33E0